MWPFGEMKRAARRVEELVEKYLANLAAESEVSRNNRSSKYVKKYTQSASASVVGVSGSKKLSPSLTRGGGSEAAGSTLDTIIPVSMKSFMEDDNDNDNDNDDGRGGSGKVGDEELSRQNTLALSRLNSVVMNVAEDAVNAAILVTTTTATASSTSDAILSHAAAANDIRLLGTTSPSPSSRQLAALKSTSKRTLSLYRHDSKRGDGDNYNGNDIGNSSFRDIPLTSSPKNATPAGKGTATNFTNSGSLLQQQRSWDTGNNNQSQDTEVMILGFLDVVRGVIDASRTCVMPIMTIRMMAFKPLCELAGEIITEYLAIPNSGTKLAELLNEMIPRFESIRELY
jgi:hypothetical protein